MSANANRVGASLTPVATTVGVVGTSDRVVEFQYDSSQIVGAEARPIVARPVYVTNLDVANALFIKINGTDADPASATSFDIRIPAMTAAGVDTTMEITANGVINVGTLSLFYAAAGDFANAVVRGWSS